MQDATQLSQDSLRTMDTKTEYGPWFDGAYILRLWKRWFFAAFCAALTVGILTYVVTDMFVPNRYTASALTSVVPKTNNATMIAERNITWAVTRSINMWNSNVLLKEIKGQENEKNISGTFQAEQVSSGILRISGTANTAQEAYYLLNAAINSYKTIASNFDSNYNTLVLTRVTQDSINVTRRRPLLYAGFAFIGVMAVIYVLLLIWSMFTLVLHSETQARQVLSVSLYEAVPVVHKRKKASVLLSRPGVPYSFQERIEHLASRLVQHLHRTNQKVVMVTSVTASEGKSTISSNLAITLARRGKKVLLLDLDLRKPSICRVFGRKEGEGDQELFDLVMRKAFLSDFAESIKEVPSLHVLWQFHAVKDSDQRIEESELKELLDEAREKFDYIILDTPPLGPVRDSSVIAASADCTVMVLRQDMAHASAANAAIEHLEDCGAACCGAVLNQCRNLKKVDRQAATKHGKYGYYYGYGYQEEGVR